MDFVSLPIKLSVAGIRWTGYVIETQVRVAQVLGQAAMEAGPFVTPKPKVLRSAPKPKAKAKPKAKPKVVDAVVAPSPKPKRKRQPSKPPAMPEMAKPEMRLS